MPTKPEHCSVLRSQPMWTSMRFQNQAFNCKMWNSHTRKGKVLMYMYMTTMWVSSKDQSCECMVKKQGQISRLKKTSSDFHRSCSFCRSPRGEGCPEPGCETVPGPSRGTVPAPRCASSTLCPTRAPLAAQGHTNTPTVHHHCSLSTTSNRQQSRCGAHLPHEQTNPHTKIPAGNCC